MSLQKDINSLVTSVDLQLYDTSIVNENDETIFRVSVMSSKVTDGKREGVSLDTCVELTHLSMHIKYFKMHLQAPVYFQQ